MDELAQAKLYVERAQKRSQSGGCGCFGDSYSTRSQSAIELYNKAIVIFQREQKYYDAGKCLEEVAFLKEKLGEESQEEYQESAHCYSFVDKKKSAELLQKCVKKFENDGKFNKAAEIYEKMALFNEEEKNFENSVGLYQKAAQYYSLMSKGYMSKERNCKLKFADISIVHGVGDWKEAVEVYTSIGKAYLLEPMLKYNAKDMFFKIVLLYALFEVIKLV